MEPTYFNIGCMEKMGSANGNRRLRSAQTTNRTQSSNGLVAVKKIPHPEKNKP
jgi:hypothetical protein